MLITPGIALFTVLGTETTLGGLALLIIWFRARSHLIKKSGGDLDGTV